MMEKNILILPQHYALSTTPSIFIQILATLNCDLPLLVSCTWT